MSGASREFEVVVGIRRPESVSEQAGERVMFYWGEAAKSDLRVYIEDACRVPAPIMAVALADAARRWFRGAWARCGDVERQFPVESFRILIYEGGGAAGRLVVEVDVLAGRVVVGAR